MNVFKQIYEHFFVNDPKRAIAEQLWVEYYFITEEYDRTVCKGWFAELNVAMPSSYQETLIIRKFEKEVKGALQQVQKDEEISEETMKEAKHSLYRYSHEGLRQLYYNYESHLITADMIRWMPKKGVNDNE